MNIMIRGKNIQVTPALKDHVERKIGKLQKFVQFDEAQVALSVEKERQKIEVTIPINGYLLRGEEETNDMYASIDLVLDKLEKQVKKYKGKISRQRKNRNGTIRDIIPDNGIRYDADDLKIVRTKRFPMKPMSVDEAIMQMDLLGHNFFVFTNAETNQVNVVYKRKDGNYGLIETQT